MLLFPTGLEITADEALCLDNDLLDIEDWVRLAVAGKAESCWKRMRDAWVNRFINDPAVKEIAGSRGALLQQILNHPDYQNRRRREVSAPSDKLGIGRP